MKTKLLLIMALFSSVIGFCQTVTTVTGSTFGDAVGSPTVARFWYPYGITNDGGNVYVTDSGNNKIKKILSDNSTVSFVGSTQGFVNGTGAAARFNNPTGIVRIDFNDFLVCDADNNAIRKVTAAGVVTTFAGGTSGNADGTGTSAQFSTPYGIAIDAAGNAYVTDYGNYRIRKISTAGDVTTLAGSTQGYTDGTGTAAQFFSPIGIAVDANGNVFVGDNNGRAIRKITPSGVVTTFAGGNNSGYVDGNGTAAQFNGINGLSFDGAGNLIVMDTYNYRIRKISPTGDVTTFAGSGAQGNADGSATTASFTAVVNATKMMNSEDLYLTDNNSHRIRKITPGPTVTAPTVLGQPANNITSYSAYIPYSLNANNAATTSVINYGVSSGALTSQKNGLSSATGSNYGQIMLSGLSASTIYYYQIVATNSAGSTSSTIENFTTTATPPSGQLITEYDFNNTYNNINGNTPFGSNTGTSFVTGRDGVTANGALNINNTGSIATITDLPYGFSARSVSLWVKTNFMNTQYNMIFSYGMGSSSNAFGASYAQTKCEMFGYGNGNNFLVASANANNTWYHFVFTYDGANAKIYKNGVLLITEAMYWNTINSNNAFKLGRGVGGEYEFNGAIDDLKIYNYALTDAEVTNLYTNNSLTSQNFNQNNLEVSLYPNPANDVLNIEMTNEVKAIEIYNIQGQKVKAANQKQINVSDLANGMYMIKIQDTDNAVSTKKFMKQ